jgi:hypothetical protein
MRPLLLATTLLAPLAAAPAHADISPITGKPEPTSNAASNITPSNTRSQIAPALPAPPADGAHDLLMAASQDLATNRTGAAQEALERAETRILDRTVPATLANTPDPGNLVNLIAQARTALGNNDLQSAGAYVQQALQALPPDEQGSAMATPPAPTLNAP